MYRTFCNCKGVVVACWCVLLGAARMKATKDRKLNVRFVRCPWEVLEGEAVTCDHEDLLVFLISIV